MAEEIRKSQLGGIAQNLQAEMKKVSEKSKDLSFVAYKRHGHDL